MYKNALTKARSFLFVPGHHPHRFEKALFSAADAIVIDLEDAVPLDAKENARHAIASHWASMAKEDCQRILVRINPFGTPWHYDDLTLLNFLSDLGGTMLPKAESAEDLRRIESKCDGLQVLPLIETATGIAEVNEIARADNVVRMGLGHIDLQADLGMAARPDEFELLPARWALVLASRLAGLPSPVDGVTTSTTEEKEWINDAQQSRRLGFGAKLCIHPAQIAGVHAGFAPSAKELNWAHKVIEAERAAGGGAFSVDGKMVDPPVILLAHQLLERAS